MTGALNSLFGNKLLHKLNGIPQCKNNVHTSSSKKARRRDTESMKKNDSILNKI